MSISRLLWLLVTRAVTRWGFGGDSYSPGGGGISARRRSSIGGEDGDGR